MGNHNSSRSLNRDSNSSSNNASSSSNQKGKRSVKPKFANPENRVLPVVTNVSQKLRSTDNGNILQSGGTISGRRNNYSSESSNDSEFTRFLQRKSQVYQSPTQNVPFNTMFGHKKSHSDPDIVSKMMEENETEDDEDGKYESESNSNQRSIIALSPSKAKIRSRKKKKAPEPPQPNTLPRMVSGRNNLKCESQNMRDFNPKYDCSEAPRRPLPPIPLEEMPPPPPPPPPDYHKATSDREISNLPGKNFLKNRRVVDKWKFSKPNSECFVEKRQRSKSLDRTEDYKFRDTEESPKGERFDRNYSFRNLAPTHRLENSQQQCEDKSKVLTQNELNDAIIDAAKKRSERVARCRMYRNSSFKSSMNLSDDVKTTDTGQMRNRIDSCTEKHIFYGRANEQTLLSDTQPLDGIRIDLYVTENDEDAFRNKDSQSQQKENRTPFETEKSELNKRIHNQNAAVNGFKEQTNTHVEDKIMGNCKTNRKTYEIENGDAYTRVYRDQFGNRQQQSYSARLDSSGKVNGARSSNENNNALINNDSYINCPANDINNIEKYKDINKNSQQYDKRDNQEYRELYSNETLGNLKQNNSANVTGEGKKLHYSHYRLGKVNKANIHANSFSNNFSRTGAIHKKCQDNRKKNDYRFKTDEIITKKHHNNVNRVDLGILPTLVGEDQIVSILPSSTISSSSVSEEEMEINLQLRPTLPRRPVDIPRFSPTDVWKSINLDFFKSHQQRSDVSSEDGDDIMEEKIHRINRAVAPRRMIHDRSGDSGISPDAGSPMLLNEHFDSPVRTNGQLCPTPNVVSNEDGNATWIPQHDLDDSECGSDISPEDKINTINETMQPKFALPNLMFPSRSLPRTDHKLSGKVKDVVEKEKSRNRDRRKRNYKNPETQHFNSLRNLKRVLGIRTKATAAEVNGLDSNWSLSRSLPNFEDVNKLEDEKPETEVPELSVPDHIRRSNSESRMPQQETTKLLSENSNKNIKNEWRKSFPGHPTDGHVMYLPEYHSAVIPLQISTQNDTAYVFATGDSNNISEYVEQRLNSEQVGRKAKSRKKFSYQSTVRQQEKKKLQEQLAKEVEEKEKKRETEIEWMNIVEDEFRKQRFREKSDVRQRLRIYNLQENKDSNNVETSCNVQDIYAEKDSEVVNTVKHELKPIISSSSVNQVSSEFLNSVKDIVQINSTVEGLTENYETLDVSGSHLDFLHTDELVYDNNRLCNSQENDSVQHFSERVRRAFVSETQELSSCIVQNVTRREETHVQSFPKCTQNGDSTYEVPRSECLQNGLCDKGQTPLSVKALPNIAKSRLNGNSLHECLNGSSDSTYREDFSQAAGTMPGIAQINSRGSASGNFISQSGEQRNVCEIEGNNTDRNENLYNSSNVLQSFSVIQGAIVTSKEKNFTKTELESQSRSQHGYASSFEDKDGDAPKNGLKQSDRQQPTGMKKWLRRQNRDHVCQENMPRPEPEGGRSSSDDCRYMDGKRDNVKGRLLTAGAHFQKSANYVCSHGNGLSCGICKRFGTQAFGFSRDGTDTNSYPVSSSSSRQSRPEKSRDDKKEIYPILQVPNENGSAGNLSELPVASSFIGQPIEEYELHTRLCRTSSGRTFESHSYYALERRKEYPNEYESCRKTNVPDTPPKGNFFSSLNFEKELKENVRKKSRDFEKRSRKFQPRDYDSDDSGSDRNEPRYQRHNVRGQKKKALSENRESSFSRNHPHRNGARLKSQPNGQPLNGRNSCAPKNNAASLQQQRNNSGLG